MRTEWLGVTYIVDGNVAGMYGNCFFQTAIHGDNGTTQHVLPAAIYTNPLIGEIMEEKVATRQARMGDYELTVDVEYPVYYTVKYKNAKIDEDPIAFLLVETEQDDIGFPVEVAVFCRKNFTFEKIRKAEAETYEVFGVAPTISPEKFAAWIADLSDDMAKKFKEQGIIENIDGTPLRKDIDFDLDFRVTRKDLKGPKD